MTLAPNTIEEQLKELERQYQHACNLISGLTELGSNQRQMIDRRDKTIFELNEQIEFKDRELAAMEIAQSDLRMKLVAAECKACKCDQDTYKGC